LYLEPFAFFLDLRPSCLAPVLSLLAFQEAVEELLQFFSLVHGDEINVHAPFADFPVFLAGDLEQVLF
jgi:hypothetical protein